MTPTIINPAQGGGVAAIDALQAGLWVPAGAPFCSQVSSLLVSGRSYYLRFVCPRAMTITKIGFVVAAVATADDPCDVGIYSANGQTLLSSSGSTAGKLNAATGIQTLNLQAPVQLSPNTVYYASFACGAVGGTAAQTISTDSSTSAIGTPFGTTLGVLEAGAVALFPLSAPAPSPNPTNRVPIMGLQT